MAGCSHYCSECQNPVTWDPNGGIPFDQAAREEVFAELSKDYISGITFSGGDPLYSSNEPEITKLARQIRESFPLKTIWLYTGYTWDEIKDREILQYLDVLVDGRYVKEQRDTLLHWRGSANQRVIDVKKTLEQGRVVLHCD